MCQGLLTGTFKAENNFDEKDVRNANPKLQGNNLQQYLKIVEKLKGFAQSIDRPLVEVALKWLLADETIPSIFCGLANPAQVEQNIQAVKWELNDEMMAELGRILAPYKDAGLI